MKNNLGVADLLDMDKYVKIIQNLEIAKSVLE